MGGELRKISKEELEQILGEHERWIESEGGQGKKANLHRFDLARADLSNTDLSRSDLSWANLTEANLTGALLLETNLDGASLYGAKLSKAILLEAKLNRAKLRNADLTKALLAMAKMWAVNLKESDLSGALLSGAYLRGANLKGCVLQNALLSNANLSKADMRGADLHGANLCEADIREARVAGVDFSGALFAETLASNRAQLAEAVNLINYDGISFDEDELDQEKESREKRAENIFDVNEKGIISFSIPSTFPPLHVAEVIAYVTLMAECVRLAFTADYETPKQLGRKVANPALWTGKEEKYAARITAMELKNPIMVDVAVTAGIGSFILGVLKYGGPILDTILKNKRETYLIKEATAIERRRQDLKENQFLAKQEMIESKVYMQAARESVSRFSEEDRNNALRLVEQLAGKADNPEKRLELGAETSLRGLDRLKTLLRGEDAKFSIDGEAIDLRERKADDYPETESEQNPTGKPEE